MAFIVVLFILVGVVDTTTREFGSVESLWAIDIDLGSGQRLTDCRTTPASRTPPLRVVAVGCRSGSPDQDGIKDGVTQTRMARYFLHVAGDRAEYLK